MRMELSDQRNNPIASAVAELRRRFSLSIGRRSHRASVSDVFPQHRSALAVLVMPAPPEAGLVASLGCAVKPLEHTPEDGQPGRIGGIGVVGHAVLARERGP